VEGAPGEQLETVMRPLDGCLYDGTAGVALFLAELHAITGDERLRDVATGALRHAVGWAGEHRAGLYCGSVGVALVAARAGDLLDEEELANASQAIAAAPRPHDAETDLLNGLAGTALGLVALDPADEDLARLDGMADAILARGRRREAGLSWPTVTPAVRLDHLLGMAHGAAGIGLSAAALWVALGREDLAAAAREAARYERAHRDPASGRWPDLRSVARSGAVGASLTMGWCHGTPGIALARLHAGTLLGDDVLLTEAREALDLVAASVAENLGADGSDACLCHGTAGNADILLEGARLLPDPNPRWKALAAEVASVGAERSARGRGWPLGPFRGSPALMVGEAGVGLFLLRLAGSSIPTALSVPLDAIAITRKEARRAGSVA
jgi:lantibiotic modifying enzyme